MQSSSLLIKPASSNCNIDCGYCFYKCLSSNREKFSLGFMSEATLDILIKNAIDSADEYLNFAFQGGEPMLAGLNLFRKAVELQKKYSENKPKLRIENTLQTNGVLMDDEWAKFLKVNNFLVGISLDGPKKLHDFARKDYEGKGSFERVINAVNILKRNGVEFNIVTVVTEETASQARTLYNFYKRNDFRYIQMIPCMNEEKRYNGSAEENKYAVTPISYGKFLNEFFDLWYEDFKKGNIIDVRMFSNLAQMTVGFPPEECGMCGKCHCYFAVEGDGSVYPCDFYCLDEYRLGDVHDSFEKLKNSEKAKTFERESEVKPDRCMNCRYYSLCRGGCKRFRQNLNGQTDVNYYCEGYKMFYEHTLDRLFKLGRTILNPLERKNL